MVCCCLLLVSCWPLSGTDLTEPTESLSVWAELRLLSTSLRVVLTEQLQTIERQRETLTSLRQQSATEVASLQSRLTDLQTELQRSKGYSASLTAQSSAAKQAARAAMVEHIAIGVAAGLAVAGLVAIIGGSL